MSPLKPWAMCAIIGLSLTAAALTASAAPLAKNVPARIVPIGDSITEGKFVSSGGYRKLLQDMLKKAGYTVTFVGKKDNGEPANATGFSVGLSNPNHEGYGSFRIDTIMDGGGAEGHSAPAIEATLDADKPDVILMMLGTNDLIQQYKLTDILSRLDRLVGRVFAHAPKVKLVLAAPTPMAGERRASTDVYGSGVSLIVSKYKALGDAITFVDMDNALKVTDLGDGIHPTAIGYAKMANVWFQALTGLTPPPVDDPNAPFKNDLALNKPWTCSDPNSSGWNGLTDGDYSLTNPGCFATGQADAFPKTVTIDLQHPAMLSSLVTATVPDGATKTVIVSVSQSADSGFATVGTHVFVQHQDEKYKYTFSPVSARYVRLTFADHYPTGLYGSPLFVFLQEVEVYPPEDSTRK